jgi:hypothetical protein
METAKGRNQMTDIQLLVITETLQQIGNQIGNQIVTMKQDTNDFKIYLSNGQLVKIDSYGDKGWFLNGKHHLEDGPAFEYDGGTKVWCQNNIVHKIEYKDSKTCRWQKQLFHLNQLMKKNKSKKENTTVCADNVFPGISYVIIFNDSKYKNYRCTISSTHMDWGYNDEDDHFVEKRYKDFD